MNSNLTPTQNQIDQAALAHQEFEELINRLVREGVDYRAILSGASCALAQSIMVSAGPEKVSIWFATQSALTMNLGKPISH